MVIRPRHCQLYAGYFLLCGDTGELHRNVTFKLSDSEMPSRLRLKGKKISIVYRK